MTDLYKKIFLDTVTEEIFPKSITDSFFDALFGDPTDGAYNIALSYIGSSETRLEFAFELKQRKNKCLKCSLTYGLPMVFAKHPIINLKEILKQISLKGNIYITSWKLGNTIEKMPNLHIIPLLINFKKIETSTHKKK